jgi:hypothetical protein
LARGTGDVAGAAYRFEERAARMMKAKDVRANLEMKSITAHHNTKPERRIQGFA